MRLVESWLQLEEYATRNEKAGHRINVIACKMFIDSFGKYHTQTSIFDSFSSIKQVFESKDVLCKQGANCLESFNGFKL